MRKNVGANLSQQPIKASALELLRLGPEIQRGTTIALPAALEQVERRDHAGENLLAVRDRIVELRAEMSLDPAVVEATQKHQGGQGSSDNSNVMRQK